MTRPLPSRVQPVAKLVVELAGGYLHNTIRERHVTCSTCSAPTAASYTVCFPCSKHEKSGIPRADRVAAIVYAVQYDSQAYRLVRNYKADTPGPSMKMMMESLLAIGLQGHGACDALLAGQPANIGWAVVPSTSRRDRPQPLRQILLDLAKPGHEVSIAAAETLRAPRDLRPENFAVTPAQPLPEHVLLIDDSWVSGGHAQSAAAALKRAGVVDVSILVVARILDPSWDPNPAFIKSRLGHDFDPSICPWTGAECP